MTDMERFYQLMASYYRNRKIAAEGEARVLWDHCLDLIREVRDCDGSEIGVDRLKASASNRLQDMQQLLERIQVP